MIPATVITVGISTLSANAQTENARTEGSLYNPLPMSAGDDITDSLSNQDIPTGYGGFYRDYIVTLEAGDMVLLELTSEEFDTIVTLITPDGIAVGENDDGPDGTTNSLLFSRITTGGEYIVRVSPYAGQGVGAFNLKVSRLAPVDN